MKLTKHYKSSRKNFASSRRKSIKHYFSNTASKRIITNKNFWKAIKHFLTNKCCFENSDIMLGDDQKKITYVKKLVQLFSDHYIKIVEQSCGIKPRQNLIMDQAKKWSLNFNIRKIQKSPQY